MDDKPSPSSPVEKSESGLKAGYADDNKQFNLFLNFLEKYKTTTAHLDANIKERIILSVKDNKGFTIPNASIQISANNKLLATGTTYADGNFLFFPSLYGENYSYITNVEKILKNRNFILIDKEIETKKLF